MDRIDRVAWLESVGFVKLEPGEVCIHRPGGVLLQGVVGRRAAKSENFHIAAVTGDQEGFSICRAQMEKEGGEKNWEHDLPSRLPRWTLFLSVPTQPSCLKGIREHNKPEKKKLPKHTLCDTCTLYIVHRMHDAWCIFLKSSISHKQDSWRRIYKSLREAPLKKLFRLIWIDSHKSM